MQLTYMRAYSECICCVLGSDSARQGCHLVSIALKIVIKSQLCIGRDILCGKQPNGQFTMHQPLLCLTVGITGVIDEPAQSPLNAKMIIKHSTAAAYWRSAATWLSA